jgi:hypothetical protein
MSVTEQEPEYLEVDNPVPGQSYVCLSFVSPDKIFPRKEAFFCKNFIQYFLQRYLQDQTHGGKTPIFRDDVTPESIKNVDIDEWYDDFVYAHEQDLNAKFSEANKHMTHVRALKVRGAYETRQEAEYRAKQLQRRDPNFHVFVGQVGYWLPWDPNPDLIKDQEYLNDQLNTLMKKYMEQRAYKDEAFIEDKESRKMKAITDAAKTKAEQIATRNEEETKASGKHIDSAEVAKENIEKLREIAARKDHLIEQSRKLDVAAKLRALAAGETEPAPAPANSGDDTAAAQLGDAPKVDAMGDSSEHSDPWMRSRMERARAAEKQAEKTNDDAQKMTPEEMEIARRKQMKQIAKSIF